MPKKFAPLCSYAKSTGLSTGTSNPRIFSYPPNGDFKLGDFGIAKTVEKTMDGTKIGTYKFMAPEVYHSKPYGSAADIYSLGLVLYWLLNERRMPFMPLPPAKLSAEMNEQARNRRLSGEPFPEPKNGSKALKTIVMKACAYNPEDRYASAAEMLMDLNLGEMAGIGIFVPEAGEIYQDPAKPDEEDETDFDAAEITEAMPSAGSEENADPEIKQDKKNG